MAQSQGLTDLKRAAFLIVMETPRRSDKSTSYVRRKLIAQLEQALRNLDVDVDAGLRHMRERAKQARAEHKRKIVELEAQQQQSEAERRAAYQAAMAQRRKESDQ